MPVQVVTAAMLETWLSDCRAQAGLRVSALPWTDNREWYFRDGRLQHRTGGYFSVFGATIAGPGPDSPVRHMPMIDQPEIGMLAFLVRPGREGPQWMLQAKAEPGSTGHVQIGPSVQATRSNYRRLHGGRRTAYLDQVLEPQAGCVTRLLQSEQGSRFVGKFNMNVVRLTDDHVEPAGPDWIWAGASALRRALASSYTVNTDARSVIASGDWSLLCEDGQPFSPRGDSDDSRRLVLAHSLRQGEAATSAILDSLARRRQQPAFSIAPQRLDCLPGWRLTADTIKPVDPDAAFDVCSVAVSASRRECPAWHQPLFRSLKRQACRLFLARRAGVLCAFLAYADEPGFGANCQLGPSWQSDRLNPAWTVDHAGPDGARVWLAIDQSDEGGRFLDSAMRYEVCELETVDADPDVLAGRGGHWVSLAQLQALCATVGVLTNEARSVISLLLSLA